MELCLCELRRRAQRENCPADAVQHQGQQRLESLSMLFPDKRVARFGPANRNHAATAAG